MASSLLPLSSLSSSFSSSSVPLSHLVGKEKISLAKTFGKPSPFLIAEDKKHFCRLVSSSTKCSSQTRDTWHFLRGRLLIGRNLANPKNKVTFSLSFGKTSLLCKAYKNPKGNSQTPLSRDRAPTTPLDYPSPSPSPSPSLPPSQENVDESNSSFDSEKEIDTQENKTESTNSKAIPPPKLRSKKYRNNVLWLMGLRLQIKKEVEKVLKSELLRRVVVTMLLLGVSRIGQCILLPGFDRGLVPNSRSPQVAGIEQLMQPGLPLNFFEIGLLPFMFSSMFVHLCVELNIFSSWSKLKDEGKDGMATLKAIIWRISAGSALFFGVLTAYQYRFCSVFSFSSPIKYYFWTSILLALGSIIYVWIGDRITEDGLGHGSSVLIACSILSASTDSLAVMFRSLSGFSATNVFCLAVGWVFCFLLMTAGASFLLGARREIELEYFDTDFIDGPSEEGLEGRPYVPFPLAPEGVTPVFYAHYMLFIPQLLQSSGIGFPFELGPNVPGVGGIIHNFLFVLFILCFNSLDSSDVPGKLSQYMVKIGARVRKSFPQERKKRKSTTIGRIRRNWWEGLVWGLSLLFHLLLKPFGVNVFEFANRIKWHESINDPPKPGEETKKYLRRVVRSTRFAGGVILAILSLSSNHLDSFLHRYLKGSSIGFTSMLIIVGSVIALKRTVEAYQQMPQLEKTISKYKFDLEI